jgi:type IV secretory pathway TraG/TraD family ATPase VirD4
MKNPAFVGGCTGLGLALLVINELGLTVDQAGMGAIASLLAGAIAAKALQRSLLGASSGFWHSVPGRWLIGRVAGGAVYTALAALLWMPAVYAVAYGFGVFGQLCGSRAAAAIFPVLPWAVWSLVLGGAGRLRTPAKVIIGKSTRPFRRWYCSFKFGGGGAAGFASILEEWANRWQPGMIFYGHSLFDRHWPIGIKDQRMLLTLAGTGGGKGESAIINNVLLHDGSMVIVDPSGQIAAVTGEALRAKGFEVRVIDQLNILGQGTARLDPLSGLDPAAPDYVPRLRQLVDAMAVPSGDGRNRFFEEGGKTLCAGAIDYLKRRKAAEFEQPEPEEEADDVE